MQFVTGLQLRYGRQESTPTELRTVQSGSESGDCGEMQNPESEPAHAERNPENPEEQGEEGEGTSQGDSLMMRKMRLVRGPV